MNNYNGVRERRRKAMSRVDTDIQSSVRYTSICEELKITNPVIIKKATVKELARADKIIENNKLREKQNKELYKTWI